MFLYLFWVYTFLSEGRCVNVHRGGYLTLNMLGQVRIDVRFLLSSVYLREKMSHVRGMSLCGSDVWGRFPEEGIYEGGFTF